LKIVAAPALDASCGEQHLRVFHLVFDTISPILTPHKFRLTRTAAPFSKKKSLSEQKIISANTCCHNLIRKRLQQLIVEYGF